MLRINNAVWLSVDDIDIPAAEINRLLGYPNGNRPAGKEIQLIDWVRQWYRDHGRPVALSRCIVLDKDSITDRNIILEGKYILSSQVLSQRFRSAKVNQAIVFGVSAGEQVSKKVAQLLQEDRLDKAFFLDCYGSAVAEHLCRQLGLRFCRELQQQNMVLIPHYSPGYDGWDLSDQAVLLDILRGHGEKSINIILSEGGMLQPVKSLLGIFGVSQDQSRLTHYYRYIPCQHCSLDGCVYRRAAYTAAKDSPYSPRVETKQRYGFSENALRRWARDRVNLEEREGFLLFQFTWDGTTCGNMGQPLRMIFDVQLGRKEDAYCIRAKSCRPCEKDSHRQMCAFKKDGPKFLRQITEHDALLDQPLENALDWDPEVLPIGCQCTQESQDHKWKMVLHTLHYFLHHLNSDM